jgi:hypothetical protein
VDGAGMGEGESELPFVAGETIYVEEKDVEAW